MRVGNWLTAEEGKKLLGTESADTLRNQRNRAFALTSHRLRPPERLRLQPYGTRSLPLGSLSPFEGVARSLARSTLIVTTSTTYSERGSLLPVQSSQSITIQEAKSSRIAVFSPEHPSDFDSGLRQSFRQSVSARYFDLLPLQ